MSVPEKVVIGDAELWLGDCREILPTLPKHDAVVTDPPYGIGADIHQGKKENGWRQYAVNGWDAQRPDYAIFDMIRALSRAQIIWGGNYFADLLPPSMHWLVWDKGQRQFSLADCELAWGSQKKAARVFTYARSMALRDGKEHQTQKPVALMVWCIEQAGEPSSILDPFMGSGTTGVACAQLGRKFTGIEIEPRYFEIACRRIEQAQAQGRLFEDVPAKPEQQAMDLA